MPSRIVTRLGRYFCTRYFQSRDKNITLSSIMPKRSLQDQPEKKLKSNQNSINSSNVTKLLPEHNLNTNTMVMDNLQTDCEESSPCIAKRTTPNVTYLDTPVKSENDKKEYRVIKLENGLIALLIADLHSPSTLDNNCDKVEPSSEPEEEDEETDSEEEDESEEDCDTEDNESDNDSAVHESHNPMKKLKHEEKMAACGLSVGVGSFSDPPEIPGLAHFLEHMVFMGSEKYPEENYFGGFIKNGGGSDNASTESELTTFHFEVQERHLLSALDCFAQLFIKPLMKKDAITREREAVESEFQMDLTSDSSRKEQLFCSFARPNHPATKFSWGNLITLRDNVTDEKLYEELHKFRERHYSAHRMKLAIQARLPLDVLENYVTQCFENVPNNGLPPDDFTPFKGANSFDTPNFRRMYHIKAIEDICRVELTWSMPPLHVLYKSKPHQYVSWIIGHEGKGSLISYLRERMWCLGIYSGNDEGGFEHSSMYALFSISLMLTELGYKHLQDVLDAVFAYINMLHRECPQNRIYNEIHQIKETSFRFADEVPPVDYVEDLCESMHYYPPCDYITGSILYFEYNPEAVTACLKCLDPGNMNIMVINKNFNDDEFDKVEPWFKTKYTDMEITPSTIERWKTIEPFPNFHLPLPNPFLTDDFTCIKITSDVPNYPTKIYSDDITELWYRPDTKFCLPECYMNFYIISPMATSSLKGAALVDLYVNILKQLLMEPLYPSMIADLNHDIRTSAKGIMLKVNGFSQKLPLLLTAIADCIANSSTLITKELFEVMKEEQMKEFYNKFVKPEKLVRDVRLSILKLVHWTAVDKHTAISGIDFQEFQNFIRYFTDHVYIQCLVQGNMTQEHAIKNVQECVKILKCGPLLPNTMPQIRILQIPIGEQYCKVRNLNNTDVNSVVVNYYECGISSIRLSVIIEVLILIMQEPLFTQLRTKEQLGYDVFCLSRDTFGILGYSITVHAQADKYTTEHVDNRIEAFLESFKNILKEMSDKDFDRIKETFIKLKQSADINLKEEVDRNWGEITAAEYVFERMEKELNIIESVTIEELREWMQSHTINGNNVRKLSVHVIGTTKSDKSDNNKDTSNVKSGIVLNRLNYLPTREEETECVADTSNVVKSCNVQYRLNYLPITEKTEKCSLHITNIEEYKSRLYSYPADLKSV